MTDELATKYDPADTEPRVAARWKQAGAFHADPAGAGAPYCIVIPPPNVTAALHMGHALNNTLQDILIRWRRMAGDNAVWIPGTDHAGIATQTVVEKRVLAEEGKKRTDFERDEFVAKIQAWKDEYEKRITEQLVEMGCSCDWERQRFTMDEMCATAVREAFFQLFKDGLIYRGKRLVNWDPATQTALADDEVEMREIDGHFWYLKYPLTEPVEIDGKRVDHVTVATTRPETMLGDTAVAVNPKDPRAAALVGKTIRLPIVNREIPIIADDYVVLADPDSDDPKAKYATGFLKVTPAHDPNDWEIGLRHGLPVINIMADDASISDQHGWPPEDFSAADPDAVPLGLDRYEAREAIVDWFRKNNLLEEVRPYRHSVGHSYRSHVPIEPYLSDQWYVKVTDDRLRGAALRAMAADDQASHETSPDREGGGSGDPPTGSETAYLITFTTYGTWLHGDDRGSIDTEKNDPGTARVPANPSFTNFERGKLKHPSIQLTEQQRQGVRDAIREVCHHRAWRLNACNVRTNHVHAVVTAIDSPEKVMNDFKAYATRCLAEQGLVESDRTMWTRHGSTRYLNEDASVIAACRYVLEEQGDDNIAVYSDGGLAASNPLPHGRGSLRTSPVDRAGWQGQLSFHPPRYAKTFRTWHENLRDWCISRQLWWGHRIPVWSKPRINPQDAHGIGAFFTQLIDWERAGRIAFPPPQPGLPFNSELHVHGQSLFICVLSEYDFEVIEAIEKEGYSRDPDVLDTWFSSALWPFSTLGWPDDTPELQTWNPGSVLCTAREIITLWVSRMVMFNLYFLDRLPFTDVFIHAMIQDGDGRKMSKSLGNGVDPLDIIHSHGSDAMRYTLAAMTTTTQDVRLPVVKDPDTGRNTSDKFDLGRNFANKLWNAARFALQNLEQPKTDAQAEATGDPDLANRWILSRLAATVNRANEALEGYEFSVYAQGLYDFFWRDLCDWYVEAVKPTVQTNPTQQRVLAACIDVALRLLHPVMPFITERLWERLNEVAPDRAASVSGITIPSSDLLIRAAWPVMDQTNLINDEAEQSFALIQEISGTAREVRTSHKVPPSETLSIAFEGPQETLQPLLAHRGLIGTFANANVDDAVPDFPDGATPGTGSAAGVKVFVYRPDGGLVDSNAERDRLIKQLEELTATVERLRGRLASKSYVDKAPVHLVQQTRDQMEAASREASGIEQQLAALA